MKCFLYSTIISGLQEVNAKPSHLCEILGDMVGIPLKVLSYGHIDPSNIPAVEERGILSPKCLYYSMPMDERNIFQMIGLPIHHIDCILLTATIG